MNFFKFILGDTIKPMINSRLTSFDQNSLNSSNCLPQNFYYLIIQDCNDTNQQQQTFNNLISHLKSTTTIPSLFKLLTIIFTRTTQVKYDHSLLQVLQNLQIPNFDSSTTLSSKWVKELTISCKSYLIRLPSLSEMMQRALNKQTNNSSHNILFADLYLVLNLFSLLFPSLTNGLNTIGRYFMKDNPFFYQFYNAVRQHLSLGYSYMQFIVNKLIKDYKAVEIHNLQILIQTLPQIELMCDKIEQLLLSKHFKGSPPAKKLYLKEDSIQQICYHIRVSTVNFKVNEIIQTTEDEYF